VVLFAYVLAVALLVTGYAGSAAAVFVWTSLMWTLLELLKRRRETRRRKADRQAEVYRRAELWPMLLIWQCSEVPGHRGWRYPEEPAGTCDFCLAQTQFEHEVITAGRTYTPAHPEGLL